MPLCSVFSVRLVVQESGSDHDALDSLLLSSNDCHCITLFHFMLDLVILDGRDSGFLDDDVTVSSIFSFCLEKSVANDAVRD